MGMASGKESELEDVPTALYRSAVWDHFAFRVTYNDSSKTVAGKSVVYANSNTTNMSAHL